MDKLHIVPSTLSSKGRVSLSPEILPLPHQERVLQLMTEILGEHMPDDHALLACLQQAAKHYVKGMSLDSFLLRSRAGVYVWCQNHLASILHQDVDIRRQIRTTLSRCIPACVVTSDMVSRCEMQLRNCGFACETGYIIHFAASELLREHASPTPLLAKLCASAKKLLPPLDLVSRDDLRLVTLHALYDPSKPLDLPVPAYLDLRLGYATGSIVSIEAIAAETNLPAVYIRELEQAALNTLLRGLNTEEIHA